MTLINLLTRVHFADGVLEEALHSELEANKRRRPLVIAADDRSANLSTERFFSGFPRRAAPIVFSDIPPLPNETAVRDVAEAYRNNNCDVLVAYGSAEVIDLAKAARVAIAYDDPLETFSVDEGGSRRINGDLPRLYAVPGIMGFAAAISSYVRVTLSAQRAVLLSSPNLIPCITICDPTLTLDAPVEDSALAAVGVIACGVDSYLSPRYHPPADGLALDALNRTWNNIGLALQKDDLAARRELMAAGLNSSLSLQKGLCVVHAICNAVSAASAKQPSPNAVGGVIIAKLVEHYEELLNGRADPVKRSLRIGERQRLSDGLRALMSDWPIPKKLSDIGVEVSALAEAATMASRDSAITNGPRSIGRSEIRNLLSQVH